MDSNRHQRGDDDRSTLGGQARASDADPDSPTPPDPLDLTATPAGDGLDDTVADVELEEVLDKIHVAEKPTSHRVDHEAGSRSAAWRVPSVRAVATSAVGQLVGAVVLFMIGATLVAIALAVQTRNPMIAAGVVAPPAFFLAYRRYQHWLSRKTYLHRLLESLGEDMSGLEPEDRS